MPQSPKVPHYDAQYGHFASRLYTEIRTAAFGQDIGQNGWLTADEHDLFSHWLELAPGSRLLDVACGSGGPALRIAQLTGCTVDGVDIHAEGIAAARAAAERAGLAGRASFQAGDAADALPFESSSFDGLICTDAVNHLPDRAAAFLEWHRVLKPGGRLTFTDPIVVTGPLTNEEIAIRSSIGFFLFVPPGYDERLLAEAGFSSITVYDRTDNMANSADRWRRARAEREHDLRAIEGDDTFVGQQAFLEMASRLGSERRLSRLAFRAVKPVPCATWDR